MRYLYLTELKKCSLISSPTKGTTIKLLGARWVIRTSSLFWRKTAAFMAPYILRFNDRINFDGARIQPLSHSLSLSRIVFSRQLYTSWIFIETFGDVKKKRGTFSQLQGRLLDDRHESQSSTTCSITNLPYARCIKHFTRSLVVCDGALHRRSPTSTNTRTLFLREREKVSLHRCTLEGSPKKVRFFSIYSRQKSLRFWETCCGFQLQHRDTLTRVHAARGCVKGFFRPSHTANTRSLARAFAFVRWKGISPEVCIARARVSIREMLLCMDTSPHCASLVSCIFRECWCSSNCERFKYWSSSRVLFSLLVTSGISVEKNKLRNEI